MNLKNVIIYTDGACSGNPGKGGWAAILKYNDKNKTISGYEEQTTNNRMELTAVIKALENINEKCNIIIYSDSTYVIKGATEYLPNWLKNNWKCANKKDVKNVDLWKELNVLLLKHNITWKWVKGHSTDQLNNEVDKLAVSEIKKH